MVKRDREVPIEVVSRHQHVSDKTRQFAAEKASRLWRYNDRVARIQVILDEAHGDFLTEIIVHVDCGATTVGRGEADGYRASLDQALLRLERQLKRDKEKRRNHKHEPLDAPADPLIAEEPTYEEVVQKGLRA